MPESRGSGSSVRDGWLSSAGTGAEHAPSWRTEGAVVEDEGEEEGGESSGSSPDTLNVDLGWRGERNSAVLSF